MKRNMLVGLVLAMLAVFCVGGTAEAKTKIQESFTYEKFKYSYEEDGTIRIRKYFGGSKVVVVPAEINGVPVRHLGDVFAGNRKITKVYLPEGIEEIRGFRYCTGLREVKIPKSTKIICSDAFSECKKLKSIELPEGLESIGSYAFQKCRSLKEVVIPDTVTNVGTAAFYQCKGLKKIVLPETLTSIKTETFSGCEELTAVKLPKNLKTIGKYAFMGCIRLKEVTIPAKLTQINSMAFYRCRDLKKITVKGKKIRNIGERAFSRIDEDAVFDVPDEILDSFKKKLANSKLATEKSYKYKVQ